MTKRLLTIGEAADYLGYKSNTVWKMIGENKLTEEHGLLDWNGRKRFDKQKLDQFIETLTTNV